MYSITSLSTSILPLLINSEHGFDCLSAVLHAILKKPTRHSGGRLQETLMVVGDNPSAKHSGTGGVPA